MSPCPRYTRITNEISTLVRELVAGHGTQAAPARAAGVSVQTIARARRGVDGFLTDVTLGRLLALDGTSSLDDFPWHSRAGLVAEGWIATGVGHRAVVVLVDGTSHKLCRGPAHRQGALLPLSEFNSIRSGRRAGQRRSQCKACDRKRRAARPRVAVSRVGPIFVELVHRLSKAEAARRMGVEIRTVSRIYERRSRWVHAETVEAALSVLLEARARGEVCHRDSIAHGAAARGRPEKTPRARRDLYRPAGDDEAELRRRARQSPA